MSAPVIGILKKEEYDSLDQSILGAILQARQLGYEVVVSHNFEILNGRRLAGLIHATATESELAYLKHLQREGLPVVAINALLHGIPSVMPDNAGGIMDAVNHLASLGHKRIAYLRGPHERHNAEERYTGFIKAHKELHLDFDPSLVIQGDFGFHVSRQGMYNLLSARKDFTAVVCSNDKAAIGAICSIRQLGSKVPEDIAVIGFCNFAETQCLTDDHLTSVNYPVYEIGLIAMDKLHQLINGREIDNETRVPCKLIARDTCGGSILKIAPQTVEYQKGDELLRYLLRVGGDLEDEYVEILLEEFHGEAETTDPMDALKTVFSKGIRNGLNPYIFHHLLTRLGNSFDYWSTEAKGNPALGQMLGMLQEVSESGLLFYNRYTEDVQNRFAEIGETLIQPDSELGGLDTALETMRDIRRRLGARYMSLVLFDEPKVSVTEFSDQVTLWQFNEDYTVDDKRLHFDIESFKFDDILPASRSIRSVIAVNIASPVGYLGILFLDTDIEYLMLTHRLTPFLSGLLQRAMTYASLQDKTSKLASEKRKVDTELVTQEEARHEAEAANLAKSEFLAVISHELRTPMSNIIGMSDIALEDQDLVEDQRSHLNTIKNSADLVLGIINDLRDFHKIETGNLQLRNEKLDISRLVAESMSTVKVVAEGKGLVLKTELDPDLPSELYGDPIRLKQILVNLLENAVTFTERGEVEAAASLEKATDDGAIIVIKVSDTGTGISPEERERISKALEGGEDAASKFPGVGLAIASQLISQMGGDIWLDEKLDHGSRFGVRVTLSAQEDGGGSTESISEDASPVADSKPYMLVISDTYDIKAYIEGDADFPAFRIDSEDYIPQAIKTWKEAFANRDAYKVVILESDSLSSENHAKLQEIAYFTPSEVVLIAPEGSDLADSIPRDNLHDLSMPLRKADLLKTMKDIHFSITGVSSEEHLPESDSPQPDEQRSLSILIVDDNTSNQLVAQHMLERNGHNITKAFDAPQGIKLWEMGSFDLILMDVQMPGMDGWEATRRIREAEKERGTRTPIVALTSHAIDGYDKKCYEAGMDGYLTKPIERKSFLEYVESVPERFSNSKTPSS